MSSIYVTEPNTNGKVLMKTTLGDLDIELWPKECPVACRNFVQHCLDGYYNNTIFHRMIPSFILQGGDPTGTGFGGEAAYGEPFKDEFHSRLRFTHRGLLAMANTEANDNRSQFFFTLEKTEELNGKNTIFGKIANDTIYNLLKFQDLEVDEDDRPLYPPKVISTDVIYNPFDDVFQQTRAREQEETTTKSTASKKKNFTLLSFGDQAAMEDEEEAIPLKVASSHDVLDDPRLLKQAVRVDDGDEEEAAARAAKRKAAQDLMSGAGAEGDVASWGAQAHADMLAKRAAMKRKKGGDVDDEPPAKRRKGSVEPSDDEASEPDQAETKVSQARREQDRIKKEILSFKKSSTVPVAEQTALQKQFIITPDEARRQRNAKKRTNKDAEILARLERFEQNLRSAQTTGGASAEPTDANDTSDWRSHKLTCEKEVGLTAQDHMAKKDDASIYQVFDPLDPNSQTGKRLGKKELDEMKRQQASREGRRREKLH